MERGSREQRINEREDGEECTTRTCDLGHGIANEGRTSTYDAPIPIVPPFNGWYDSPSSITASYGPRRS